MKINKLKVEKLARLSRLSFNDQEIDDMISDLKEMLKFVDKLNVLMADFPEEILKVQGTGLLCSAELRPEIPVVGFEGIEPWCRRRGLGVIHGGMNALRFTSHFGITSEEIALSIAPSLAKKAISSTVNGEHFDLSWPIEEDAKISINTLKDTEPALELVRHDLAHIMARAVQEIWPDVKVTIGPVIRDGWYYDFDRKDPFTTDDLILIEKKMNCLLYTSPSPRD